MRTNEMRVGLVLGAMFLVIPCRWASAGELPVPSAGHALLPLRESSPGPVGGPPPALPTSPLRLTFDPLRVEGAAFYEVVGRPDLAASYRSRRRTKVAVRIAGGVTVGVGFVALAAGALVGAVAAAPSPFCILLVDTGPRSDDLCTQKPVDDSYLAPGGIVVATGIGLLVAPSFWSNDPVSDVEKATLARQAVARQSRSTGPITLNLGVAPTRGAAGGTLMLSGRF
jgi:hypothetical protein